MSDSGHYNSAQHIHSHAKFYLKIFIVLACLTIITVIASRIDFGVMNLVIAMVIASAKALLVALFFMHLKYENPLTWLYAAFPLVLLGLLIGLTSLDGPFRIIPTGIREGGKAVTVVNDIPGALPDAGIAPEGGSLK